MSETAGNLFILAAPSGAGKSSLIKALLKCPQYQNTKMQVSVSHTTRQPRLGEVHSEHYFFVSKEEFEQLIADDVFFEWAEVFGNYYGTSRQVIEQTLASGIDVFLDIDWQGARQVKEQLPETTTIFIAPPSIEALQKRLEDRNQDSPETIEKRMIEARSEISHYHELDYIVINDDFDTALAQLQAIVDSQRLATAKQAVRHKTLFANLLK
jgi:guanylate kinase